MTEKKMGRPITRAIKLNATPERVARALFAAVRPPNPSKRTHAPKQPPDAPAS